MWVCVWWSSTSLGRFGTADSAGQRQRQRNQNKWEWKDGELGPGLRTRERSWPGNCRMMVERRVGEGVMKLLLLLLLSFDRGQADARTSFQSRLRPSRQQLTDAMTAIHHPSIHPIFTTPIRNRTLTAYTTRPPSIASAKFGIIMNLEGFRVANQASLANPTHPSSLYPLQAFQVSRYSSIHICCLSRKGLFFFSLLSQKTSRHSRHAPPRIPVVVWAGFG